MIQKLTRQDSFTDFVAELIGQPNLSLALGAFLIGLLGNVLASALGDWYLWLIPGHWIIIIGLALAVVGLYGVSGLWLSRCKTTNLRAKQG